MRLKSVFHMTGLILLMLITPLLFGCGGGSSSQPSIGLGGGTVYSIDRSASLTIPPGALGHDVIVSLVPGSQISSLQDYDISQGPAYDITISDPTGRKAALGRATPDQFVRLIFPVGAFAVTTAEWGLYLTRSGIDPPVFLEFQYDFTLKLVTTQIPIQFFKQTFGGDISGDFALVNSMKLGLVRQLPAQPTSATPKIDYFSYVAASDAHQSGRWKHDDWQQLLDWTTSSQIATKRIALVIPGTWSGVSEDPNTFPDQLHEADFLAHLGFANDSDGTSYFNAVIGIKYETVDIPPDANGQVLADRLKPFIQSGAKFYLFAHSQGGLVARWAIEKGGARDVVMLTMLGTPNAGIPWAGLRTVSLWKDKKVNVPAIKAMAVDWFPYNSSHSSFLTQLNGNPTPGNARYYVVAGNLNIFNYQQYKTYGVVLNLCGKNDDSVPLASATGPTPVDLSNYCKGGFDNTHNVVQDEVFHEELPELPNHPKFAAQLGVWIRQQSQTNGTIDIH